MIRQDIKIPETLNDIILSDWLKWQAVDKEADEDFVNRRALSIFYGIRADHYNGLKVKDIEHLINSLNKVFEEKPVLKRRFKLNGIEYGLIPNFDNMTFGEFIDLDKYASDKERHKLMSILYRPIKRTSGKRYKIAKYKGSDNALLDMPLGVMLGCIAFFLTIAEQLLTVILKSTQEENPQEWKEVLAKSGVGMEALTPLPEDMFGNIHLLQNLMSIRH